LAYPIYAGGGEAAITTACKNVKEAVQWLDYAYSYDGHLLFNFGVEGLSYTWVNGFPKYTDIVTKNPQYSLTVAMARYFRSNYNGPFVQDLRYIQQYLAYPEQVKAVETWSLPTHEKQMPPVSVTADESKKYAAIMQNVNTLFEESFSKTVIGQSPVADWDKVVAQLKQLGIADAIAVQQAALDRYNKR
jgi:putative aldouronate transport system substrate-binding protein